MLRLRGPGGLHTEVIMSASSEYSISLSWSDPGVVRNAEFAISRSSVGTAASSAPTAVG
jgi:hypothetical protein